MNRLPQKLSLVAQSAAILKEAVLAGEWTEWLPGEHELCRQIHVSRRTVRAALDQLAREGIIKCHRGKRRQIMAGRRHRGKPMSRRVVLLMPVPVHSLDPFGVFLIDQLREHLSEADYLLETHASRVPYRARIPREMDKLEQTLRPAGWVLLHSTAQMQGWFAERQLPCVVVGSRYRNVELPSVDTDYDAVCRHAVGLFIARGHRRLLLLNPRPEAAGDSKTEEGFRAAAQKTNARDVQADVVWHDGIPGSICATVDRLLRLAKPPTAFLVSRPRHVLTVLSHLLHRGSRFPQNGALISRDDESFLEDVVPTIARYSKNPGAFASKVSRVVLDMVQGTARPAEHRITPTFIPGETLG